MHLIYSNDVFGCQENEIRNLSEVKIAKNDCEMESGWKIKMKGENILMLKIDNKMSSKDSEDHK